MKLKPVKRIPAFISFGVILFISAVRLLRVEFFERLERLTFDMRARHALKFPAPAATNLGFVAIDEATIAFVRTNKTLKYNYDLYWPRSVYGRLVEELADQAARAVAFDVFFTYLRPDHNPVTMADNSSIESDEFFGLQLRHAGNVILGVPTNTLPPAIFRTNAFALGDISTDKDSDGILRRAQAFKSYRHWHSAFRQVEADPGYGVDLSEAIVQPGRIILPRRGVEDTNETKEIVVPLDQDGNFDVTDFWGDQLPAGVSRKAKPFTQERIWQMGIVLAAQELKLDLAHAEIDLAQGRIILQGQNSLQRAIPVDRQGFFYIDWSLVPNEPRLTQQAAQDLLRQNHLRLEGNTNGLSRPWRDKLVVVGSSAMGNDLTDWGSTPLSTAREPNTLLAGTYWNVANSLLTGRFVRRSTVTIDLVLIAIMGIVAAFATWQLRVLFASAVVALISFGYVAIGTGVYVQTRYWIPLVLPVFGALLMNVCLVTWRAVFEQAERRRVKAIFSRVVSPKIMNELLEAETLSLSGARREVTILFADVRGFTELTDTSQEQVEEFVRKNNLTGDAAEACRNEQARETLATVNTYLGLVAETILKHDATLDKFIGDCVMAFWGAPTPNPKHALCCARAAIEAQRAISKLNLERGEENRRRELENLARVSAGLPPKPLFPILLLGSGINTGMATVGLMGSQAAVQSKTARKERWRGFITAMAAFFTRHARRSNPQASSQAAVGSQEQQNYTVFGREVNLASRLESASGRGRIFIGEATFQQLQRDDPDLAKSCVLLDAQKLKGFSRAVTAYEVPWRPADAPPSPKESPAARPTEGTSFTQFAQSASSSRSVSTL